MKVENQKNQNQLNQLFPLHIIAKMLLQIALFVGFFSAGSLLLGRYMDAQFNTRPIFTVLFAIISSLIMLKIAYQYAMKAIKHSDEIYPALKLEKKDLT